MIISQAILMRCQNLSPSSKQSFNGGAAQNAELTGRPKCRLPSITATSHKSSFNSPPPTTHGDAINCGGGDRVSKLRNCYARVSRLRCSRPQLLI